MGIPGKCGVLLYLCIIMYGVCPGGAIERPQCPTDPGVRCQPDTSFGLGEYAYSVEGERVIMEMSPGGYFSVQCSGNVSLGARSLPRFSAPQRVANVKLQRCPLGERDSYADALARLNVTVVAKLSLYDVSLPLRRAHFAALPNLTELVVQARASAGPSPEAGFLAALAGLRSLRLEGLPLPPHELERLPTGLASLHLVRLGVPRVTAAALARLPLLRVLIVRDVVNVTLELEGSVALREVTLDAWGAAAPAAAGLQRVTLWRWGEPRPARWPACAGLQALHVVLPSARALPPEWVSRCSNLTSLQVSHARLAANDSLPERLLLGASALLELNLTSCRLTSLPYDLFLYTTALRSINLSHNNLLTLPSDIFAANGKLQKVELSYNKLSVGAVAALSSLVALRWLALAGNPLGNLCGGDSDLVYSKGLSELHRLEQLEQLWLSGVGVTRLCLDWRQTMLRLRTLDLSNNNITNLMYEDLQYLRDVPDAKVDLTGNPVSTIEYTYQEYNDVKIGKTPDSQAQVSVDSWLRCDCRVYWAARALRARSSHVRVDLQCAHPRAPLVHAPSADMMCAVGGAVCPEGCRCWWRPRAVGAGGAGGARERSVVRVQCEGAGREAPPPLPAPAHKDLGWELLLANNSIAHLRREDLPADLLVLDLRNNRVRELAAEVTDELLAGGDGEDEGEGEGEGEGARRVLLGGNPLACGCGDPLPGALRRHRGRLDFGNLTCGDELAPFLAAAPPAAECARRARLRVGLALAGALVPVALAAAAQAAWLTRPDLRLRVKAALAARGWLAGAEGAAEGEGEDGRRFDAFVSHSHHDEAVAREVVARLEAEGHRVCVHYRDWAPGAWIPAQIAASVRASRRTVALVSEHFLASRWACAEFREAHAAAQREARPTLVLVLVGRVPRARLAAHPDLSAHLAANTYVEWGDPWFWEKLALAMPRPAASVSKPAPPPPPAPPAPPAPLAVSAAA